MDNTKFYWLMMIVWLAPKASSEHPLAWVVFMCIFMLLSVLAEVEAYIKKKIEKMEKEEANG